MTVKFWRWCSTWLWRGGIAYSLSLILYLFLRVVWGDAFWWLALAHTLALWLFMPLFVVAPLIIWISLRRKQHRYAFLQACLLVLASAWLLRPLLPKQITPPTKPTLTAINLNVWKDSEDAERIIQWLVEADADLIVIHETLGRDWRDLLPYFPYIHVANGDTRIFSKHRFLAEDKLRLENRPPRSLFFPRVEIELAEQRIAVYGVHLVNPHGTPRLPFLPNAFPYHLLFGYDDTRRDEQLDYLLGHVQTENYPYIVLGDFNISHTSPDYDRIAQHMQDAYAIAGTGLGLTWPIEADSLLPPLLRLDYIWYGNGLRVVHAETGPNVGSDHLPVLAVLELP